MGDGASERRRGGCEDVARSAGPDAGAASDDLRIARERRETRLSERGCELAFGFEFLFQFGCPALRQRRWLGGEDGLEPIRSLIAALEPDLALRDAVTVRTQWFDIEVEVELGETAFSLSERVELTQDGRLRRHAQRFGAVQ